MGIGGFKYLGIYFWLLLVSGFCWLIVLLKCLFFWLNVFTRNRLLCNFLRPIRLLWDSLKTRHIILFFFFIITLLSNISAALLSAGWLLFRRW